MGILGWIRGSRRATGWNWAFSSSGEAVDLSATVAYPPRPELPERRPVAVQGGVAAFLAPSRTAPPSGAGFPLRQAPEPGVPAPLPAPAPPAAQTAPAPGTFADPVGQSPGKVVLWFEDGSQVALEEGALAQRFRTAARRMIGPSETQVTR